MAEHITITMETSNAAFDDSPATEIARILRKLAKSFEDGSVETGASLRDINGNIVGDVQIVPRRAR